jgi:hypothetical protein
MKFSLLLPTNERRVIELFCRRAQSTVLDGDRFMALNYCVTCWHLCNMWCKYLFTERVILLFGQTQARRGPNYFLNNFSPSVHVIVKSNQNWLLYSLVSVIPGILSRVAPFRFSKISHLFPSQNTVLHNTGLLTEKIVQHTWKLYGKYHLIYSFRTINVTCFLPYSFPALHGLNDASRLTFNAISHE